MKFKFYTLHNDLRALRGSFVENLDGGQFILLYDRGIH